MTVLTLYGTEDCHLCEEAQGIVLMAQQGSDSGILLDIVDIVDDDKLYKEYQFSIPVIENKKTGQQLFWPFELEQLYEIL